VKIRWVIEKQRPNQLKKNKNNNKKPTQPEQNPSTGMDSQNIYVNVLVSCQGVYRDTAFISKQTNDLSSRSSSRKKEKK